MATALSTFSDDATTGLGSAQLVATVKTTALRGRPSRTSFAAALAADHDVIPAIEGNHFAIQEFLHRVLHRPSPDQFAVATMRPGYQASERLIIKRPGDRCIVAHVQVQRHDMHFGASTLPIARLRDLALLAEYDFQGYAPCMLAAAERQAREDGALLLFAQDEHPEKLTDLGWANVGCHPISIVSPQRLLGALPQPRREPESVFYASSLPVAEVRLGRLTDLDAIRSLHVQEFGQGYGGVVRSEEYWAWLATSRAHDRIYLYKEDGEALGYVVVRGADVIEMADRTTDHRASARLLGQVGLDAIEQGRHSLKIQALRTSIAHDWAVQAGGQKCVDRPGTTWMAKVVSFRDLLRRLAAEISSRCRPAHELSIHIGDEAVLLRPGARSIRVCRGISKEHRLVTTPQAATQMLLGCRSAADLAATNRLEASSISAMETAITMFPARNLWRNRWDDVPF